MKKLLLGALLLLITFFYSCKDTTTWLPSTPTKKTIKELEIYRKVTYDTIFDYGYPQIKYKIETGNYTLSYDRTKGFDMWYSDLEFNVPLGKDYRLTIDGRDLFYEKYYDGSGSGLKDGFNAIAANGSECKDCVSDVKYTKAYDRSNGINFEAYVINEMKNAKKVTLQVVGEKPKELKIQKDAAEFMLAYNKSIATKVDWKKLEKDKYNKIN